MNKISNVFTLFSKKINKALEFHVSRYSWVRPC